MKVREHANRRCSSIYERPSTLPSSNVLQTENKAKANSAEATLIRMKIITSNALDNSAYHMNTFDFPKVTSIFGELPIA